jgi:hypothetical protein
MSQFSLNQLAEGIRERHLGHENRRLTEKWNRTGLLRGLNGVAKENMARLLENQTAQVLREANSLGQGAGSTSSSGDIRGFTNIAFPIVRRVFGGLVANDLVSIQPMSLPSGLLFFLDYTYGTNRGGNAGIDGTGGTSANTYTAGQSIYNNPVGKGIQSGSLTTGGHYDLVGSGFSRVHVSGNLNAGTTDLVASGAFKGTTALVDGQIAFATGTDGRLLGFDPQLTSLIEGQTNGQPGGSGAFQFVFVKAPVLSGVDGTMVKDIALWNNATPTFVAGPAGAPVAWGEKFQGGKGILNLRRLNEIGTWDSSARTFTSNPLADLSLATTVVKMVVSGAVVGDQVAKLSLSWIQGSSFSADQNDGSTLVVPSFESNFAVDPSPAIPEIDIKIESISVVAQNRKLRARWSPELAQDLNAYHSLDAEVELTQILSEQIALELDREILNDLLTQASGANYYWSRSPGRFVNKTNGNEISRNSSTQPGPNFTGTVREWYETFVETVIDVANEIHRKTLRGSANFIVVSPDVATILEASILYRPAYSVDGSGQVAAPFQIGAEKIGTLSNRFTVYKDPYFPRNKVLVGFKGGSYLETGYVYAPYVPLIVTPTIFAPEDFTPRKGVMTRYGKKMVRSDFYGSVTVLDLNII